jgi:hypothetical protein
MTLTIHIPAEVEHALEVVAQRTGQSVADFAASLLAQAAGKHVETCSTGRQTERLAALEKIGSYDTRVREGLPPLSSSDISRESIYEGRGL